jgi:DNA-binding CsgD family transcriptional regulator/tetratricopeptide (TPR) repeat protein
MRQSDDFALSVRTRLAQGRESYQRGAWAEAYRSLSATHQSAPLQGEDLERLATAAYLIGHDDEYLNVMDRAHRVYADVGEYERAVRCAFWLGLRLHLRGEISRSTGWLARARRLLELKHSDCVEQGYLLMAAVEQHIGAREWEAAYTAAARAAEIGERFRDKDLSTSARNAQGRIRIQQKQISAGLAFLDEAMLSVTSGELSPLVTGLLYCSAIESCKQVYALDRVRDWTAAWARWCERHPDMVAFTSIGLRHGSEIMYLGGTWPAVLQETQRFDRRCTSTTSCRTAAAAFYQQAEAHRLCGDFESAEEAYRSASQWGWDPQPGLALLRVAQGRIDVASAAIRRALGAVTDRLDRMRLLPAYIEIMLANDEVAKARAASAELDAIAECVNTEVLRAIAAFSRAAVDLAEGHARTALGLLHDARLVWQQLNVPYMVARVRVLTALACHALGDQDGYDLEVAAARAIFDELGAVPDLVRLNALTQSTLAKQCCGLTRRELQVLRMVAAGKTNRTIANELYLSEKTIERHVSNLLAKLSVPSRAAATAYAYEHKLI